MSRLSNEALWETYHKALELKLAHEFIVMLQDEMKRRQFDVTATL